MRLTHPRFHPAPLALAITLVLAASEVSFAQATASGFQAVMLSIASQPLGSALNELSAATGTPIGFSPALVAGKTAGALKGNLTARQAVDQLLAGSGLIAVQEAGGIVIKAAEPAGDVATLAPVKVTARSTDATEGTGSYTSSAPLTTATPLGLTLKETPQSVSVVTSQRMEDQNLTTIQQTLAQVPGIKTGSLGTELGNANARGYAIGNYQFDGVNTFVEVLGGGAVPSATLADMAIYDRIEVLRGASGLVTGAGDPSGTINMVRKKPTAEFQGSVEAGIGSWDNKRGVVDLSGPLNEARSVRGRLIVVGQDADSYIDHYSRRKGLVHGVVEADVSSSTRLMAGVEYERTKVKGQSAYVGFPLWYADGSRTNLPRSFTAASRDNWQNLESTKIFATLEQELGNDWKLKLSGNHGRTSHQDGRVFLRFNNNFANTVGDGVLLNASQRDGHIRQSTLDLHLRGPFTLLGRQHPSHCSAANMNWCSAPHTKTMTSLSIRITTTSVV